MQKDHGIHQNAFLRLASWAVQPCIFFADKLLLHEREDSRLKTSLQVNLRIGIANSERSSLYHWGEKIAKLIIFELLLA